MLKDLAPGLKSRYDVQTLNELGWKIANANQVARRAKEAGFDVILTARGEFARRLEAEAQLRERPLGLDVLQLTRNFTYAKSWSCLMAIFDKLQENKRQARVATPSLEEPEMGWRV
jgi:hypothetical protein